MHNPIPYKPVKNFYPKLWSANIHVQAVIGNMMIKLATSSLWYSQVNSLYHLSVII